MPQLENRETEERDQREFFHMSAYLAAVAGLMGNSNIPFDDVHVNAQAFADQALNSYQKPIYTRSAFPDRR